MKALSLRGLLCCALLLPSSLLLGQTFTFHDLPFMAQNSGGLTVSLVAAFGFDEITNNGPRFSLAGTPTIILTNPANCFVGSQRGVMGNSATFTNAANRYLSTVTNNPAFRANRSFSVSAWVLGGNGNNSYFGEYDPASPATRVWTFDGNGDLKALGADSVTHQLALGGTFAGTYNFVVVGWDAAQQKTFGSINGAAKTFSAAFGEDLLENSNLPFNCNWINGAMDELYAWSRVITDAEIVQLYNSGYGLKYPFTNPDPAVNINLAYQAAVTNAGGYVTTTSSNATYGFISGMISDGIWGKFNMILPYTPDTLQAALIPLKTTYSEMPGNDIFTPTYNPYANKVGLTSANLSLNGLKGDASNTKYYVSHSPANVVYAPGQWPSINDASLTVYAPEVGRDANGGAFFGILDSGVSGIPLALISSASDGTIHAFMGDVAAMCLTNTAVPGYYSVNRFSSTDLRLFIGSPLGVTHGTYVTTNRANTNPTFRAIEVYGQAYNNFGSPLTTSNAVSFVSTGTHLTEAESLSQYNRVVSMRAAFNGGLGFMFSEPTNTVKIFGQNATLRVVPSNNAPSTYQWRKNGVAIANATTSTLTLSGVALSDFGTYDNLMTILGVAIACPAVQLATVSTTTVSNWVVQCGVNGAAVLSSNTIWGTDQFWNGVVSDGNDANILVFNPFVPDDLNAALTPLVAGAGNKLWVNTGFVSSDLTVNGLHGNASSKYLETGFVQTSFTANNSGIAYYYYATNTVNGHDGGAQNFPNGYWMTVQNTSATCMGYDQTAGQGLITATITSATPGWVSAQRTSSSSQDIYFANSGTAHASLTHTATSGGSLVALGMRVFVLNNGGGFFGYSDAILSSVFYTKGLDNTHDGNLYNRTQTLRTTLGGGFR